MLKDGFRVKQTSTSIHVVDEYNTYLNLTPITGYQQFKDVFNTEIKDENGIITQEPDYFMYSLKDMSSAGWEYGIAWLVTTNDVANGNLAMARQVIKSSNFVDEEWGRVYKTLPNSSSINYTIAVMPINGLQTGDIDFQVCYLSNPILKAYSEHIETITTADSISALNSNVFKVILNSDFDINAFYDTSSEFNYWFNLRYNPDGSQIYTERRFRIYLIQDSIGGHLLTTTYMTIKYANGFAFSQAPNAINELEFTTIDDGASWLVKTIGIYL